MRDTQSSVHTTHCCRKCGCKYFDPDCPVELGVMEAEYDCEDCQGREEELREQFSKMDFHELSQTLHLLHSFIDAKTNERR